MASMDFPTGGAIKGVNSSIQFKLTALNVTELTFGSSDKLKKTPFFSRHQPLGGLG